MFKKFWVPHEVKVYELVELVGEDDEEMVVSSVDNGAQYVVKKSDAKVADETHLKDFDDLCFMNNLHEAPLLHMLQQRFANSKIYTNTGNILISMNPYMAIPGIYDNPKNYLDLSLDEGDESMQQTGPPHVYVIANNALRILTSGAADDGPVSHRISLNKPLAKSVNQSIIVSGESGAGKTEASKLVMNFLIIANDFMCSMGARGNVNLLEVGEKIKKVLLESNLILEAFGNSKTVRNDNSSRFGKYIKLQYTRDNQLLSAYTDTFLLEKSRLVCVGKDERNYHVFYQVVRGLLATNPVVATALKLTSVEDFAILNLGGCTVVGSEADDVHNFQHLCHALSTLGTNEIEVASLWQLIAVILHLGNAIVADAPPGSENKPCSMTCSSMPMEEISAMLAVNADELTTSMTTHRVQAGKRGSVHIKVLSANDVRNNLWALIKWLYKNLFNWLIRKVNFAHSSVSSGDPREVVKFIGILDIFGFEILGVNSFEQLCINYTNERLQQQFNEHVFILEQQEYAREGLSWSSISFRDNQHVIDLISKKPLGLLMILEEHGMMNRKPDDLALLASYINSHEKTSAAFAKTRFAGESFIVKHFAGDVVYSIDGFLLKNNNSMQEDLQDVIASSANAFLINTARDTNNPESEELFSSQAGFIPTQNSKFLASAVNVPSAAAGSSGKRMASADTVSFQFRNQLDVLMATLRATNPHYIKCIKPNAAKCAGLFDAHLVHEQLRYSGALEVVRIRREGYPTRLSFIQFYEECSLLARNKGWVSSSTCSDEEAKAYALQLAREHLLPGKYQAGNTMLFLTDGCLYSIRSSIMTIYNKSSTLIQNCFRRYNNVTKYSNSRRALWRIQAYAKKYVRRVRALREVRARWAKREREAAELKARLEREAAELKARLEREAMELRLRREREEAERQARQAREEAERRLIQEQEEAERKHLLEKLQAEERAAAELVQRKLEEERRRQEEERRRIEEERRRKEQEEADRLQAELEALRELECQRALAELKSNTARKLSRALTRIVRNIQLHARIAKLFAYCSEKDEKSVLQMLEVCPEDCFVRWKKQFLFAQAKDANMTEVMVQIFKLACKLYPAQIPRCIKCLLDSPQLEQLVAIAAASDDVCALSLKSAKIASKVAPYTEDCIRRLDEARNGQGQLYSGRLQKKRGTNDWKARWCVVTATDILYFAQPTDAIPKGTVPLAGCSIRKVLDQANTFEVFSPNIVAKKTFFGTEKVKAMLFRAYDEIEYFDWLLVLRAVTGSVSTPKEGGHLLGTVYRKARSDVFGHDIQRYLLSNSKANNVEVQYWIEVFQHSETNPFWCNHSFGNCLPCLPGYTYCRLSFLQHQFPTASSRANLVLNVMLENAMHHAVVRMGELSQANLVGDSSIFWGSTILVPVPVENWEQDLSLSIKLLESQGGGALSSTDLVVADLKPGLLHCKFKEQAEPEESALQVLVEFVRSDA